MSLTEFFWPTGRKIAVWSGILFVSIFLYLSLPNTSASQGSPSTGLASLPAAPTDLQAPICGDGVCGYPETQLTCPSDCRTSAGISYLVASGDKASVWVEFHDSRYVRGQRVHIDLAIQPENVTWNSENGCPFGGYDIGPENGPGYIAWPAGTVSEDGHFRLQTDCTLPSDIGEGAHMLSARTTIIF